MFEKLNNTGSGFGFVSLIMQKPKGKLNNTGSGFGFVSLITGVITMIVVFFIFVLMKYELSVPLKELFFNEISGTSFLELLVYIISFSIGFFIHGVRYLVFDYYRRLYKKNKRKTLFKRIIFYLFRKGTIIEECLDEKREKGSALAWIRDSDKPTDDVWNYARKISLEFPQVNVYQFYYHSEAFQCLDTAFFLLSFITFCLGMFGIVTNGKSFCCKYVSVLIFSQLLFFFHWLCKKISMSFARRFFVEIQIDLNVLTEKTKCKN